MAKKPTPIDPADKVLEFFAAQEKKLIGNDASAEELEDFQQAKKGASLIVAVRARRRQAPT